LDGSAIVVKMHKVEQKGGWGDLTLAITGTVLVVAGVAITATVAGAPIGLTLAAAGKAMLVAGVIGVLGTGMLGYTMIDPAGINAFSECASCNGIGSIKFIPPSFSLREEVTITYQGVMIGDEKTDVVEEGPYCHHLVN